MIFAVLLFTLCFGTTTGFTAFVSQMIQQSVPLAPSMIRRMPFAPSISALSAINRPYDWTSENWNWGYGDGDAHDAARELRSRLSTPDARVKFINDDETPLDEMILALMLSIQRRGPQDASEYWEHYNNVSNGIYGDCIPPANLLRAALDSSNDDTRAVLRDAANGVKMIDLGL